MIQKTATGYQVCTQTLVKNSKIPSQAVRMYHQNVGWVAIETLSQIEMSLREFSATTLTLDSQHLEKFRDEIQWFVKKI